MNFSVTQPMKRRQNLTNRIKLKSAITGLKARFMRALFYYHAMDLFRNIPFVTENDPTVGYLPPRYTSAQIFSYIESELNAITNDMLSKGDCPYGRALKEPPIHCLPNFI